MDDEVDEPGAEDPKGESEQEAPRRPIEPYQHDPAAVPDLARLIDQACDTPEDVADIADAIPQLASEHGLSADGSVVRELSITFYYELKVPRGRPEADATLEPVEDESDTWLRPMRATSNDVRQLWAELADEVMHPLARARLHDILFCLRHGNGRDHAEKATCGYLAAVGGTLDRVHQAEGLVRAWTLSRSVGLDSVEVEVVHAMKEIMREELDNGSGTPGITIPLLKALGQPGSRRRPAATDNDAEVDALLDQALTHYPRADLVEAVAEIIRRRHTDSGRREAAGRAVVQASLNEANQASNAQLRMHHLQAAAAAARRYEVRDLERQAVAGMQAIRPEEMPWQVIESSVEIPAHALERWLRQFERASDWREALARLFATGPPTGSYSDNVKAARKSAETFVFHRLASRVRYGHHGLPEQTVQGDDDHLASDLVDQELIRASLQGSLLSRALDRIRDIHGWPSQAQLETFLGDTYGCDPHLGRTLARVLRLYWDEQYAASTYLAIPQVEAAARAILLLLNEPLYRAEEQRSIGQFPGLKFLLPVLVEHGFDHDWERYLGTLLLPRGYNYRNLAAHGFLHEVDETTAALVIRACALMVLITPDDSAAMDADFIRARLARPIHTPQRLGWLNRVRSELRRVLHLVRRA